MKPVEEIVVGRLKEAMQAKGMSQTDLARVSGLPHQSVYKIIHGKRFPTLPVLEKLAIALGMDVADLVCREDRVRIETSKNEIFDLFRMALKIQQQKSAFEGLTKTTPTGLVEIVQRFGGWDFLFEFLREELEIREEAEKDYQRLRESLTQGVSAKEISVVKNRMIVSKMIAKSR
jgi:transcriptional regulator with XRE-family HTH domain